MRPSMLGAKPEGHGPSSVKIECCGNPVRGCINCPPVRKMTFDEWWCFQGFDTDSQARRWKHEMLLCWKTAQENK